MSIYITQNFKYVEFYNIILLWIEKNIMKKIKEKY